MLSYPPGTPANNSLSHFPIALSLARAAFVSMGVVLPAGVRATPKYLHH